MPTARVLIKMNTLDEEKRTEYTLEYDNTKKLMSCCADLSRRIIADDHEEDAETFKSFYSKFPVMKPFVEAIRREVWEGDEKKYEVFDPSKHVLVIAGFMGDNDGDDYIKFYFKPDVETEELDMELCHLIGVWSSSFAKSEKYFTHASRRFL